MNWTDIIGWLIAGMALFVVIPLTIWLTVKMLLEERRRPCLFMIIYEMESGEEPRDCISVDFARTEENARDTAMFRLSKYRLKGAIIYRIKGKGTYMCKLAEFIKNKYGETKEVFRI